MKLNPPETGTGVGLLVVEPLPNWPDELSPQQYAAPALLSAQVWLKPGARRANGGARTVVLGPTDSWQPEDPMPAKRLPQIAIALARVMRSPSPRWSAPPRDHRSNACIARRYDEVSQGDTSVARRVLVMRANGVRLSCGAELERSQTQFYLRGHSADSFRRMLGGMTPYPRTPLRRQPAVGRPPKERM